MYCDYEIFDINNTKSIVKYPLMFADSCSKRATLNQKPVYGFKVKIEQLRDEHKYENYGEVLKKLNDKGWKIVYLSRSNIFHHVLSGIISNQTKVFHVRKSENFQHEKIKVDSEFLYGVMYYFENLGKLEEESLKTIPHLRINYEDDLLDNSKHQAASDKVFSYLDLKSYPVNTRLKKIIPENLKDIILNYDEVIEYIQKVQCPVLVIHSPEDDIVPYKYGVELFEAANAPKSFLEITGDHNGGFYESGELYNDGLYQFLLTHF